MIEGWKRYRARKRRQLQERVLGALALAYWRGTPELAGWPLIEATGLPSGRLHVALAQLERTGEVLSRWAPGDVTPRRRFYRLADEEG